MLEISKKLFDLFNTQNISYCHFKSNEHLNAGLSGETDLDILIAAKCKQKSDAILTELNFKRFEPVNIGGYPGVVNWYGFDNKTGRFIHLHIHYQLVTGKALVKEYSIPWAGLILETAIKDDKTGVMISNPNIEYILLCTRLVLKRKFKENLKPLSQNVYISDDIKRELDYLKKYINENDIRNYLDTIFTAKNKQEICKLIFLIDSLTNREFRKFSRIIRSELHSSRRMIGGIASLRSFTYRLIKNLCRRINKCFNAMLPIKKRSVTRGVSMAFVGVDGSGKSTVSSYILEWLNEEFDTVRFYAGAGEGKKNFISTVLLNGYATAREKHIYFSNIKATSKEFPYEGIKKTSLAVRIKNLFGAIAYYKILKGNIKNIISANIYCSKGCFCIMDRYPQSQLENDHDGPKVSKYLKCKNFKIVDWLAGREKALLNSLDHGIPKFDLIFRMNVSPEVAIKRKPDHDYESMKTRADSLKTVSFSAKRVVDVNADDSLENILLQVKEIIWDTI